MLNCVNHSPKWSIVARSEGSLKRFAVKNGDIAKVSIEHT